MSKVFESVHDWDNFCKRLIHKNRFLLDESQNDFIDAVVEAAKKRLIKFPAGKIFYRARIGSEYYEEINEKGTRIMGRAPLFKKDMKCPPARLALHGRLNPLGIPVLYLSNDEMTCISEVRPWIVAEVSVGEFVLQKDQYAVDLRGGIIFPKIEEKWFYKVQSKEELEKIIWGDINSAFKRPIGPNEKELDYIPTQCLTEVFRTKGFGGVVYNSSLNQFGYNIALFNSEAADLRSCRLYKIKTLKYTFKECGKPYFIKEGGTTEIDLKK